MDIARKLRTISREQLFFGIGGAVLVLVFGVPDAWRFVTGAADAPSYGRLAEELFASIVFASCLVAGIGLNRRRWWTAVRIALLIECLAIPIGTFLGLRAFFFIGRPEVKRLFRGREADSRPLQEIESRE